MSIGRFHEQPVDVFERETFGLRVEEVHYRDPGCVEDLCGDKVR
jgi:hypothetical protein